MKHLLIILLLAGALFVIYQRGKQSVPPSPGMDRSISPAPSAPAQPAPSQLPRVQELAMEQGLRILEAAEETPGIIRITLLAPDHVRHNTFLNELTTILTLQDFESSPPRVTTTSDGRSAFEVTYTLRYRP